MTNWKEKFDEEFEYHELGKPYFTLCRNKSENTCVGGVMIDADQQKAMDFMMTQFKDFISTQIIEKLIEETPDWDENVREHREQLKAKWLGKE